MLSFSSQYCARLPPLTPLLAPKPQHDHTGISVSQNGQPTWSLVVASRDERWNPPRNQSLLRQLVAANANCWTSPFEEVEAVLCQPPISIHDLKEEEKTVEHCVEGKDKPQLHI